jgi:hypothetical protein
VDPEDQEKMTFTCPFETFAYRRMSFGLCNVPVMQRDLVGCSEEQQIRSG